jgi:hypothetical protein
MGWSSLEAQDSFNGLFTELWVAKSVSYVGKFLVLCEFDIILVPLAVIVVMSGGSVSQSLFVVDLLGL